MKYIVLKEMPGAKVGDVIGTDDNYSSTVIWNRDMKQVLDAGVLPTALDQGFIEPYEEKPLKTTERGFGEYADFRDRYGAHIRVQQSSLATEDCVWVFTQGGTDDNDGALHLTVSNTITLIQALSEWLAWATERFLADNEAKDD